MDIFVNPKDQITVEVYAWEEDKGIVASTDSAEAPSDAKIIKFTFKKPNNKQSVDIMKDVDFDKMESSVIGMQYSILNTLLREIEYDDKTIEYSRRIVDKLHPAIATAAVTSLLNKINIM